LINIIPNENESVVVYQGRATTDHRAGEPGDRALIVEGQRVPYEDLDAWYNERMLFDWRGKPFGIMRYHNGRVLGSYHGPDVFWAKENGLEGSTYEGFVLDAPEGEIENVRVEKTDILEDERYRHTFKTDPPPGLFTHVRPTTEQEWFKE
jgi:hypothetical protein